MTQAPHNTIANTASALNMHPQHPLDDVQLAIIKNVQTCTQSIGVEIMLIGAIARTVLLEHVFGLPPSRATRDVDFAVAVDSWETFEHLKSVLIETGKFTAHASIHHQLNYQPNGLEVTGWIDIVPYGGVENETAQIHWPNSDGIVMSVAGFKEAFAAAMTVAIDPATNIAVVSLPSLMLLKLLAWSERGNIAKQRSDAADIALLLKCYHQMAGEERLYDTSTPLKEYGYDIERAGAWLLGNDAGQLASAIVEKQLRQIFETPLRQKLLQHLSTAMSFDTAQALFACFEIGYVKGLDAGSGRVGFSPPAV
jgi:predicted nucleotidyltransferase